MVMHGFLPQVLILYHILPAGIGYGLITAGHGHLTTIGDGHHSITEDGIMIIIMDGCGFRIMNGARHGFPGEEVADITDGHRFHRVFHLIWQSVIIIHLPIDGSFCRIVTWGEMISVSYTHLRAHETVLDLV